MSEKSSRRCWRRMTIWRWSGGCSPSSRFIIFCAAYTWIELEGRFRRAVGGCLSLRPLQRIDFQSGPPDLLSVSKFLGHRDAKLPHLLKTSVEHEALPTLRSIRTIADFVEFARVMRNGPPLQYDRLNKLIVDASLGNFESCDALLAGLRGPRKGLMAPASEQDRARILRDLAPRIDARDRAGVAALLHEWEAWSVKAMKLEKYRERTPFPVEMA